MKNKIISSLEHVTRSKLCRVSFSKNGAHIFGGEIENLSFKGQAPPGPLHHIFTIDTADKYTPVRFSDCRFLPLIFPLTYGDGDGQISYRISDELEIEITYISEWTEGDESYFPGRLPGKRAKLKPVSYAEKRILYSKITGLSYLDKVRMNRLWKGECFKVAGMLDYYPDFGPCLQPGSKENDRCSSWKFAEFPATDIPFGDIWHDYTSDVTFIFAICFKCNQIHGFMHCT